MKTRHTNFHGHSAQRSPQPPARFLFRRNFPPRKRPLPVGRNTPRAIVLNLSTAFPACAWAFVKMM